MITEIYVPRSALAGFMADVRDDFRANDVDMIYGTVRLVERDDESFLAWARESWACIIFNLHTVHTESGLAHAQAAFQRLIDHAIARGGSYYLTYHRWATREQVEACYPQFSEFLRLKRSTTLRSASRASGTVITGSSSQTDLAIAANGLISGRLHAEPEAIRARTDDDRINALQRISRTRAVAAQLVEIARSGSTSQMSPLPTSGWRSKRRS